MGPSIQEVENGIDFDCVSVSSAKEVAKALHPSFLIAEEKNENDNIKKDQIHVCFLCVYNCVSIRQICFSRGTLFVSR